MPFLTIEDPNAKIKGSRDPLGMVPIWVAFARHVVTNLTTPSGSARGYTILLLGRYFGAQLIDQGRIPREAALDVVLRMEQLGAYARHIGHAVERDIRGIERVKKHLADGNGIVTIQANKEGLILADQKVYGLWGLFSVPARTSGLIPEGSIGVERISSEFIEKNYLPHLEPHLPSLLHALAKGDRLSTKASKWPGYFEALVDVLSEDFTLSESEFYGNYIRDGQLVKTNKQERQATFRRLLEEDDNLSTPTNREELLRLSRRAGKKDEVLARALNRIIDLEALLAPADAVFNYLLLNRNKKPEEVGELVRAEWGKRVPYLDGSRFRELLPEVTNIAGPEQTAAIAKCYDAFARGEYTEAARSLLQWNAEVMAARKSAPWVRLDERGKIDVRYAGADQLFPNGEQLHYLWRNSYFIDSLKNITRQLQEVA